MYQRDFLSITELQPSDLEMLLRTTVDVKKEPDKYRRIIAGKMVAMVFQKPSLRTRITFEVGVLGMGGHPIFMSDQEMSVGVRESVKDVARNMERWVDCIVARVFGHDTVKELAEHAGIPVVNALSDFEHPCQALADLFTLIEHWGTFEGRTLVYVGDGNNVCHSLLLASAMAGLNMVVSCPEGYDPDETVRKRAAALAEENSVRSEIVRDPREAVKGADAVYTDVWASMGQEEETEERAKIFAPYQVNSELYMNMAPDALILHCLPAHKGWEITEDVFEHPKSVVFDQAENRLHAQKAVLRHLLAR